MGDCDANDAWTGRWLDAVFTTAEVLAELHKTNPWPDNPLLPQAMIFLMTEMWDRGFSQTEIRQAFEAALDGMDRYAAGQETRD
jgi:hypothetical protein